MFIPCLQCFGWQGSARRTSSCSSFGTYSFVSQLNNALLSLRLLWLLLLQHEVTMCNDPNVKTRGRQCCAFTTLKLAGCISMFEEKPSGDKLADLKAVSKNATEQDPFEVSMGIYVFKRDVLVSFSVAAGTGSALPLAAGTQLSSVDCMCTTIN